MYRPVYETVMVPACREAGGITSFSSLLRHGKELHQDLLHCVLHALQALALDEASSVQMLQTGALSSCPKLLELREDQVSSVGGHWVEVPASESRRCSRLQGAAGAADRGAAGAAKLPNASWGRAFGLHCWWPALNFCCRH